MVEKKSRLGENQYICAKVSQEVDRNSPYCVLWIIFFIYTATGAFFIQFVLLPYVFPEWHSGNGLLISSLDSISFHRIASGLAEKIQEHGWSSWQLRPEGQAPAGIAGAVYALTVMKPYTLIPLNAALHASSALVLMRIVQLFLPKWRTAVWAVLPFLLYPSAASWYAQIHKDGFSILGCLFFLFGWLLLGKDIVVQRDWIYRASSALWIFTGLGLAGTVRPYLCNLLLWMACCFVMLLTMVFMMRLVRFRGDRPHAIAAVLFWYFIFGSLFFFSHGGEMLFNVNVKLSPRSSKVYRLFSWPQVYTKTMLSKLANCRNGFGSYSGLSNFDEEIRFRNAQDVVAYLPRAVQVAFLAPFPFQWIEQGSMAPNTIMRRVSGIEMLGVYLALLFLPYSLWHWRYRIEAWMLFLFCSGMLVIHGLVVLNIGTLYRMRFGYLMTLVALGVSGLISACGKCRKRSVTVSSAGRRSGK